MVTGRVSLVSVEAYYRHETANLRYQVLRLRNGICSARARMTDDAFNAYMKDQLQMDEASANDFLTSDGSIESTTDRMWVFLVSPLSPQTALSA
jgi:hypothetical protein